MPKTKLHTICTITKQECPLAVQWLRLQDFTAKGMCCQIPGLGTTIPRATWRSQKNIKIFLCFSNAVYTPECSLPDNSKKAGGISIILCVRKNMTQEVRTFKFQSRHSMTCAIWDKSEPLSLRKLIFKLPDNNLNIEKHYRIQCNLTKLHATK